MKVIKKLFLTFCCINIINNPLIAKNDFRAPSSHLLHIFSSSTRRQEFAGFLENVLRQVKTEDFYRIIDTIFQKHNPQNDTELYAALIEEIGTIKPSLQFISLLKSLAHQKDVLSKQVQQLLGKTKKITGCLEIGTPATYLSTLQDFTTITGPIYILNEKKRLTDYFQTFSLSLRGLFPYDTFISLNNYEPIDEKVIPTNSLELVICFIGLHHIPVEKLNAFVASLARCIKPGGVLLLRDHDVRNSDVESMVHAAHTIFNAIISNETLEDECREYRNFQPLQYWIELLKKYGLETNFEQLLQNGDPSLNTMLKFTKKASCPEEKIALIVASLKEHTDYERSDISTYLTTPEWFNVDVSQEYGKFIEHTPFYEFPYMKSVQSYWNLFAKSFKVAQKKRGALSVITSPYTLMNLFIGCTMSIEYAAKSLLSLPIRAIYSGEEPLTIQLLIKDPADQINTIEPKAAVKNTYDNGSYKLIEIPRYKEFLKSMQRISRSAITIIEIASHKEIQCKIRYSHDLAINFDMIDGCTKEYEWQLPTDTTKIYAAVTITVDKLLDIIKEFEQKNIEIIYIHDF